tara:strand:- start:174 stop:515 length:342 start_codon:yes stop_codon:yes gene_type:complete
MRKTKINHVIEYLSPTFILSYFFIHNIFLVLVGIIFSLYLINIDLINSIIRSINKNLSIINEFIDFKKNNPVIKSNSINTRSNKDDSNERLVETIEELGFIPSLDNNDKNKVA